MLLPDVPYPDFVDQVSILQKYQPMPLALSRGIGIFLFLWAAVFSDIFDGGRYDRINDIIQIHDRKDKTV